MSIAKDKLVGVDDCIGHLGQREIRLNLLRIIRYLLPFKINFPSHTIHLRLFLHRLCMNGGFALLIERRVEVRASHLFFFIKKHTAGKLWLSHKSFVRAAYTSNLWN